jgi:tetratricopeptide (TPR) repeat protein
LALNPNSQPAHFAMAQIHFQRFQQGPCLAEIERTLELNPHNANYLAASAVFLMGIGQWERAQKLVKEAMRLNPHHPGWYHLVPFLHHFYQGKYEAALVEGLAFNTPAYFWDPLIRTAVFGHLGEQADAKKACVELLALCPDFEQRGRSLIQRMVFLNEHVDMLWRGLQKACQYPHLSAT